MCNIHCKKSECSVAFRNLIIYYKHKNRAKKRERPYQHDSTASRLLSEVKHVRARLVLRWRTTLESWVLFFLPFLPFFRLLILSPSQRINASCHHGETVVTKMSLLQLRSKGCELPLAEFCIGFWSNVSVCGCWSPHPQGRVTTLWKRPQTGFIRSSRLRRIYWQYKIVPPSSPFSSLIFPNGR